MIALWKEEIKKKSRQKKIPKTFTVTSKDKTEKTVNFKVVQLEKGGYLVSCEDITDLKRLEDELLRAQKLESIGILAGGIAHDFNNILAVVMGNISLARSHIASGRNHKQQAPGGRKGLPESKGSDTTTVNIFKRWRSGQKDDRSPRYHTGSGQYCYRRFRH